METITPEAADRFADALFAKPDRLLEMDDGCKCLAGFFSRGTGRPGSDYFDGLERIQAILGLQRYRAPIVTNVQMTAILKNSGIGSKRAGTAFGSDASFWTSDDGITVWSHDVARQMRAAAIRLRAVRDSEYEHDVALLKERATQSMGGKDSQSHARCLPPTTTEHRACTITQGE